MKVARTWTAAVVLLLSLLVASAELLSADRRVSRRARRDRIFSRTLSDHSSSMPHGFYTRSTDVSRQPSNCVAGCCVSTIPTHDTYTFLCHHTPSPPTAGMHLGSTHGQVWSASAMSSGLCT